MGKTKDRKQVLDIFDTERMFWALLAPAKEAGSGYLRHKAEDGLILRDADIIIFVGGNGESLKPADVNATLLREKPRRLIISPQYALPEKGSKIRGIDRSQLAEVFKGIIFSPDPMASVYLWKEREGAGVDKQTFTLPAGLKIEKMNSIRNEKHEHIIRQLRSLKDKDNACAKVRADLLTWTMRRLDQIPGYITYVLYEYDKPVGCVSCFRHEDRLTRIRDLFVVEEYRGRHYAAPLVGHVMQEQDGPFAVVTDCDNIARFVYSRCGLDPCFILEAYQIHDCRKAGDTLREPGC